MKPKVLNLWFSNAVPVRVLVVAEDRGAQAQAEMGSNLVAVPGNRFQLNEWSVALKKDLPSSNSSSWATSKAIFSTALRKGSGQGIFYKK